MKRTLTTVGRSAFAGWALFTGTIVVFFLVGSLIEGRSDAGAVLALVALGLERLIKRPAANPAAAADEPVPNPAVWPPAPKPPQ